MQTTEYLAAAKRRLQIENNAAMAARLGLSEAALSRYGSGARVMDDYTAAQVADILGLDPLTVIAQANAEREKDKARAAYWARIANKAAMTMGFVLFPFVVLYLTGDSENAMSSIAWIGLIGSNTNYGGLVVLTIALLALQATTRPIRCRSVIATP